MEAAATAREQSARTSVAPRATELRQTPYSALNAPKYQPPQTFIPDFDVNRYLRAQNNFQPQRPTQQAMPKKDISSLFVPKYTAKPYATSRYQGANTASEDIVQYLATQRQLLVKSGVGAPDPTYIPEAIPHRTMPKLDLKSVLQNDYNQRPKPETIPPVPKPVPQREFHDETVTPQK